ncbi:MAG: hypothetical protein Q9218_007119 [Villophora microphyllina]
MGDCYRPLKRKASWDHGARSEEYEYHESELAPSRWDERNFHLYRSNSDRDRRPLSPRRESYGSPYDPRTMNRSNSGIGRNSSAVHSDRLRNISASNEAGNPEEPVPNEYSPKEYKIRGAGTSVETALSYKDQDSALLSASSTMSPIKGVHGGNVFNGSGKSTPRASATDAAQIPTSGSTGDIESFMKSFAQYTQSVVDTALVQGRYQTLTQDENRQNIERSRWAKYHNNFFAIGEEQSRNLKATGKDKDLLEQRLNQARKSGEKAMRTVAGTMLSISSGRHPPLVQRDTTTTGHDDEIAALKDDVTSLRSSVVGMRSDHHLLLEVADEQKGHKKDLAADRDFETKTDKRSAAQSIQIKALSDFTSKLDTWKQDLSNLQTRERENFSNSFTSRFNSLKDSTEKLDKRQSKLEADVSDSRKDVSSLQKSKLSTDNTIVEMKKGIDDTNNGNAALRKDLSNQGASFFTKFTSLQQQVQAQAAASKQFEEKWSQDITQAANVKTELQDVRSICERALKAAESVTQKSPDSGKANEQLRTQQEAVLVRLAAVEKLCEQLSATKSNSVAADIQDQRLQSPSSSSTSDLEQRIVQIEADFKGVYEDFKRRNEQADSRDEAVYQEVERFNEDLIQLKKQNEESQKQRTDEISAVQSTSSSSLESIKAEVESIKKIIAPLQNDQDSGASSPFHQLQSNFQNQGARLERVITDQSVHLASIEKCTKDLQSLFTTTDTLQTEYRDWQPVLDQLRSDLSAQQSADSSSIELVRSEGKSLRATVSQLQLDLVELRKRDVATTNIATRAHPSPSPSPQAIDAKDEIQAKIEAVESNVRDFQGDMTDRIDSIENFSKTQEWRYNNLTTETMVKAFIHQIQQTYPLHAIQTILTQIQPKLGHYDSLLGQLFHLVSTNREEAGSKFGDLEKRLQTLADVDQNAITLHNGLASSVAELKATVQENASRPQPSEQPAPEVTKEDIVSLRTDFKGRFDEQESRSKNIGSTVEGVQASVNILKDSSALTKKELVQAIDKAFRDHQIAIGDRLVIVEQDSFKVKDLETTCQQLRNSEKSFQGEFDGCKTRLQRLEGNMSSLETFRSETSVQYTEIHREVQDLQTGASEAGKKLVKHSSGIGQLQTDLSALKQKVSTFESFETRTVATKQKIESDLEALQTSVAQLQEGHTTVRSQLDGLQESSSELKKEPANVPDGSNIDTIREELGQDFYKVIQHLREKVAKVEEDFEQLSTDVTSCKGNTNSVDKRVDDMWAVTKGEIYDINKRLYRIEDGAPPDPGSDIPEIEETQNQPIEESQNQSIEETQDQYVNAEENPESQASEPPHKGTPRRSTSKAVSQQPESPPRSWGKGGWRPGAGRKPKKRPRDDDSDYTARSHPSPRVQTSSASSTRSREAKKMKAEPAPPRNVSVVVDISDGTPSPRPKKGRGRHPAGH